MEFNFGKAVEALEQGQLVTRKGWNGKDMFLFYREGQIVPIQVIKTLPEMVKRYFSHKNLTETEFTGYICMKTADNKIVNGWLASQTDITAEDWQVYKI